MVFLFTKADLLALPHEEFVSAINSPQLEHVRDVQLSYSTDQQWWLAVPNGRNPDGITLAWINTQRLFID